MELLITGALGHIGSRLVRRLPSLLPQVSIVMVDNLVTQRFASLFELPHPYATFIEGDVLHDDVDAWLEGVDAVVHLAAITDATSSFERRDEVERENYLATERVARACSSGTCQRL